MLLLFSSDLERDAAFPDGIPAGVATAVVGIGLIDAALGTAAVLHEPAAADGVLFVGTCGAHHESGIAIGEIVLARRARLSSGDVSRGEMRLPSLVADAVAADETLVAMLAERAAASGGAVPVVAVSCALGITESDVLAALIAAEGAVENMEVFAVLRAASLASPPVPAAALLGVTNMVGPEGGREWRERFREMMRLTTTLAMAITAHGERL